MSDLPTNVGSERSIGIGPERSSNCSAGKGPSLCPVHGQRTVRVTNNRPSPVKRQVQGRASGVPTVTPSDRPSSVPRTSRVPHRARWPSDLPRTSLSDRSTSVPSNAPSSTHRAHVVAPLPADDHSDELPTIVHEVCPATCCS
jgi:hypothetical protein